MNHRQAWQFVFLWAKLCFCLEALVTPDRPMDVELFPPTNAKQLAPLRESKTPCSRLDDIDSQVDNTVYRDSDLVTWGHETCHGIASRIRQIEGPRTNGFYLFDNQYIAVQEVEGLKLSDVAKAIPPSVRKQVYQLYLVDQQQYWNNEPSYLLDEAYAYQNGTVVGMQADLLDRAKDSFARATEMATYCVFMASMAKQSDINAAVKLLCRRTTAIRWALEPNVVSPQYADFRATWDMA